MKQRTLFLCLFFFCVFSLTVHASEVELLKGDTYKSSSYVVVEEGKLSWSVKNTSTSKELRYSIMPFPTGWCGTVFPIEKGILKPGDQNIGIIPCENGQYQITLDGESGAATITSDQDSTTSDYVTITHNQGLLWSITNISSKNLPYSVHQEPTGWCGAAIPLVAGVVTLKKPVSGFREGRELCNKPYALTIHGGFGKARLSIASL